MNNIIFFWKSEGKYGFLSNWSDHPIKDEDGIYYHTVEHYMMYKKAMLMNDIESAQAILFSLHPYLAKTIGRDVKNFDQRKWDNNKCSIVLKGITLKVAQHPQLKQLLIHTNGKTLAEASPYDKVWGIGMTKVDIRSTNPNLWTGKNLLGKLWMELRHQITPPVDDND